MLEDGDEIERIKMNKKEYLEYLRENKIKNNNWIKKIEKIKEKLV